MTKSWSNLAKVVYKRTYARKDTGKLENWSDTIDRVLAGNFKNVNDNKANRAEKEKLRQFMLDRKGGPAGRGLWFSGAPAHEKIGGVALNNCWYLSANKWENFTIAMDLLMLGGGVGLSVEHRFVSKLPVVRKDVVIKHLNSKDADFIVPDSREGWIELLRRSLESYFVTGKSFTYSTVCVRDYGALIKGFGGSSSGPLPLITFIDTLNKIVGTRAGKHIRPIDAMDIICATGELVVSGNVRRSAIIILGDAFDKDYLKSKRWDLGLVPTYRAFANLSIICDDVEDAHPLFWKTYENGEPFGIINRKNIQQFARMGEYKEDAAEGTNPCTTGDTEILTKDGYKRIDSLVDVPVEIWNGFEWSTVTPKITGLNQEILKLTFSDGRELKCTPYHKFHVADNYKGDKSVVMAKDLTIGKNLIKNKFPVLEFSKELPHAYTQGFVSADGMDNYNHFSLYEPKYMCLDRFTGIKNVGKVNRGKRVLTLNFKPRSKSLVPSDYAIKSKLEWLAGFLDGDACELKEGGAQVSSVNLPFLKDLQKMLSTLGVNCKIVPANPAGFRSMPDGKGGSALYACQKTERLCIGATQIQHLKSLGLNCTRLTFMKAPQRDASQFVKVVKIEALAELEPKVYCFTEPKRNLGIFNGVITGNCGEATLENYEPCNLQEIALSNLESEKEFHDVAKLLHRYGKRVTLETYHIPQAQKVVSKNRRIGTGITGCLESPLFTAETLDAVYKTIQKENVAYSQELNIPESIRTTVVKPSGTMSKVFDCRAEGIHAAYSKHQIQRIRFGANDPLIPLLKAAGHSMEPVIRFDGTFDPNTLVVDFYLQAPEGTPCADEGFDTWKQLDVLLLAQKYWSDQAVSVTVYYRKEELAQIKEWLGNNLKYLKSISFLCHNDHGFKQAPKEAITKEQYEELSAKIKPVEVDMISDGDLDSLECAGGVCPVK